MGNGWTVPEVIDGHSTVCMKFDVPDIPEYRRAFYGAINELTKWYHWDTDEETGRKIATYWSNVIYFDFYRECVSESSDEDESPWWDDVLSAAGVGAGSKWGYEQIGDWAVTAFLAIAGSPLAAVWYRTTVQRARLAFQSMDAGSLVDILIDGILFGTVNTASAVSGVAEIIEVPIDLVQFAADHSLEGVERIIRLVQAA